MTGRFRHRTNVINREFAASSGWTSSLVICSGNITTRSGLWIHLRANSIRPRFGPFFTVTSSSSMVDDRRCFLPPFDRLLPLCVFLTVSSFFPYLSVFTPSGASAYQTRSTLLSSTSCKSPRYTPHWPARSISVTISPGDDAGRRARTHEVVSFQIVVLDVDLERDLRGHQSFTARSPG